MAKKAGFVNIIGSPNVGKSTLMNALVGEKMSIITPKAQTTRHRIIGIVNHEDCQVVFSDTPGALDPAYKLHEKMMAAVSSALSDADIILLMVDFREGDKVHVPTLQAIEKAEVPVIVLINKIDLSEQDKVVEEVQRWKEQMPKAEVLPISALHNFNIELLFARVLELLPESPAYYPEDQITDRPIRFFIGELIREQILQQYQKEIPYSCEVVIEEYKEEPDIVRIRAVIVVTRESQKGILIGHKGSSLKRVGTRARIAMEKFIEKKVFLETFVKVDKDWRDVDGRLKMYGYN